MIKWTRIQNMLPVPVIALLLRLRNFLRKRYWLYRIIPLPRVDTLVVGVGEVVFDGVQNRSYPREQLQQLGVGPDHDFGEELADVGGGDKHERYSEKAKEDGEDSTRIGGWRYVVIP